ncbi:hypothetical protein VM1G_10407 [Cytospora mali]|uniref:Zn(2)-C6 fungal-type domain-containing protein n=1 Tax=Cytospora mali TaxID=578113 RepID=A0A194VHX6_CYTMA|nr:hypothetical protein VM1G_10407 [Valsa mali]
MPCSFCLEEGVACKMVDGVKSCSQCTQRARSCDASRVPVSSLSRITDEMSRLDGRELEEEERLIEIQARLNESLSRLSRLKKQKRFLQEKGVKLVNEGLAEEERSRTAEVVQAVVSAESAAAAVDSSTSGFNWSSVNVANAVVDWSGFLDSDVNVDARLTDVGDAPVGGSSGS